MRHPLVRLACLIDWREIERTFGASFTSGRGRPALPPRLVAGLLYLQHTFDASDGAVVDTWVENPYWQYFCGQVWLQTEALIDPSSLTRWRKRIGEEGVETLLMATIEAARRGGVVKTASPGLGAAAAVLLAMALFVVPTAAGAPSPWLLGANLVAVGLLAGSVNSASGRAIMAWFADGRRSLAMSVL